MNLYSINEKTRLNFNLYDFIKDTDTYEKDEFFLNFIDKINIILENILEDKKTLFVINDFFIYLDGELSDGFEEELNDSKIKLILETIKSVIKIEDFDIAQLEDLEDLDFSEYDKVVIYYDSFFPNSRKGDIDNIKNFFSDYLENKNNDFVFYFPENNYSSWQDFFKKTGLEYKVMEKTYPESNKKVLSPF